MISHLLQSYRIRRACKRLEKLVAKRRASFEVQDFKRRRAAMLRHTRGAAA